MKSFISVIFVTFLLSPLSAMEEDVVNRNYMIRIIEWFVRDSSKVNVNRTIHSYGDGSTEYPNISFLLKVPQPLSKIFARVTLRFSSNNCNLCHVIADIKFDACKLFSGGSVPRNVMKMFAYNDRYGFYPKKCPIQGEFHFRHLLLAGQALPSYAPNGLFSVIFLVGENRKMNLFLGKSNFTGKIISKKSH